MSSNSNIEVSAKNFRKRQTIIQKLMNRFSTYGYKQVRTPTFETYDLYMQTNGLVNHNEMIKTIDPTGQVLVLRPDITIPITRQIASSEPNLTSELRYFYVLDVFRQLVNNTTNKESTQAGIEYFGNNQIEVDAEVIALAIHILQDLEFKQFKIELGHARFLKELINELPLNKEQVTELNELIQAKNSVEIDAFLTNLQIDQTLIDKVSIIPFLYGEPKAVFERAKTIVINEQMEAALQNLEQIYQVLTDYGFAEKIAIDFGFVNDMGYYSDIIFQGFVETVGKPVLMGGRYDRLADQFNASIPAIGFAFDIEALLAGMNPAVSAPTQLDLVIYYDEQDRKQALQTANQLRNEAFVVITVPNENKKKQTNTSYSVQINENKLILTDKGSTTTFNTTKQLSEFLQQAKEEN